MAIMCKILYWENGATVQREVAMGDTNKMGDDVQIPKENVLAIMFSSKVQGTDTRVRYLEKFDNYMVSTDNLQNIDSLYGWDDGDGGWYRRASPFAQDGYMKEAGSAPRLRPYTLANHFTWIFTGIMLSQTDWDSTFTERDDLR